MGQMLDVEGVRELKLAAAYYGRLDKPTKDALRKTARTWAPHLKREAIVRASGDHPAAMALARSGKITLNRNGLVAVFGSTGRLDSSSGRSVPVRKLVPFEFGAAQGKYERYLSRQRTSKRAMQVRRRAQAQMRPRNRTGYNIFPAVAETTPSLVAMWVRAVADAARGQHGR